MLPSVLYAMQPQADAPPTNPPPEDGEFPGWHSWGGAQVWDADGTDWITVTADGTEASFTLNSNEETIPDSIVGRIYTGSARVKAGTNTAGRTLRLVWRERPAAGGSPIESQSTVVLTSVFQPITATHTAVYAGSAIDMRLSCPLAQDGDEFVVE